MTMRLNRFIASSTGMSRRAADRAIAEGRVTINGATADMGVQVTGQEQMTLDGQILRAPKPVQTIMLNKPAGYIVSRDGQGGQTVYDLLPVELDHLKPVGRLDKDSSGLLLLTNDGALADELTHPRHQKTKVYEIRLSEALAPLHRQMISDFGIQLDDGTSKLGLERLKEGSDYEWRVTMSEGRNRQIRRTFAALGYRVPRLHRTQFGTYQLGALKSGTYHDV